MDLKFLIKKINIFFDIKNTKKSKNIIKNHFLLHPHSFPSLPHPRLPLFPLDL